MSTSTSETDPGPATDAAPEAATDAAIDPKTAPLRSLCTDNFAPILEELGASVFITTYQAGKLVVLRPRGKTLNTHFRSFNSPMGMALQGDRLSIGTPGFVSEFRNVPAVGQRQEPLGEIDACFLPRSTHVTGNVQVHEMAYDADGALWFANTRFSCLSTLDGIHSFLPRWQPPFITQLAPEDRCHLNGLGMRDGRPQFVTALGMTDSAGGWRVNKRDGGVLLEVPSGKVIASGLSMPHSPRWYDDRLWVLESGKGTLSTVDPKTGVTTAIATMPGFTRGLDFCGPLAFVGLSQVRETAVFSGLPITEQTEKRSCGVWVVNIHSGKIIAFVEFEDALQEIFAVQVMPGWRNPDLINDNFSLLLDSFELPLESLYRVESSYRFLRETNGKCGP